MTGSFGELPESLVKQGHTCLSWSPSLHVFNFRRSSFLLCLLVTDCRFVVETVFLAIFLPNGDGVQMGRIDRRWFFDGAILQTLSEMKV